ncbi:CBS domain-containing protein, partial [Escherichia coli]
MSDEWKKVLLTPAATIRQALEIINRGSLQIALVSSENTLLGSVTDGDIRRGLLRNLSLDDAVEKVMNTSPLTADVSLPKDELL